MWFGKAVCRVSRCCGLPADGHVLFSTLQAKIIFYHFGPDRAVAFTAVAQTDSSWQLLGHRGSVFIIGDSAAAKDTVIAVMRAVDRAVEEVLPKDAPCSNVLTVGHPTYNGLLASLRLDRPKVSGDVLWIVSSKDR